MIDVIILARKEKQIYVIYVQNFLFFMLGRQKHWITKKNLLVQKSSNKDHCGSIQFPANSFVWTKSWHSIDWAAPVLLHLQRLKLPPPFSLNQNRHNVIQEISFTLKQKLFTL